MTLVAHRPKGLLEGGLYLREVARRVYGDKVHQSVHCDGNSPQILDDGGGAVEEG
jgi:hypothetical protein